MAGHVGIVGADRVQGQKNSRPEPEDPANPASDQQSEKTKAAEPAASLGRSVLVIARGLLRYRRGFRSHGGFPGARMRLTCVPTTEWLALIRLGGAIGCLFRVQRLIIPGQIKAGPIALIP